MSGDRIDFFVSHAGADRAWAEWVAWQLVAAGYSVELDVWDWAAGRNFVTAMSDALDRADRVVALFSVAYFERERYTALEWSSSMVQVPGMEQGRLVPVRIEEVPSDKVPAVLRQLVHRDLFGVVEEVARQNLLAAVAGQGRPVSSPPFPEQPEPLSSPDGTRPRLPGTMPLVWGNVPPRNPAFTGRDQMLVDVRERLLGGMRTVVHALHGMGGVGKTQLAAEYAHRFSSEYDLVWWITAENASLIGEQFAEMADALGCARPGAGLAAMRHAVLTALRQQDRWLLVFDNAEDPGELAKWLPGGSGHVLITSRVARWEEIAVPVEVNVLARAESVAILLNQAAASLSVADAQKMASALGDLPLAIAQAAGFMADTGIPAAEYLELLAVRAAEILDQGRPVLYPQSLAAVTQLAFDKLQAENPTAARLAELCAVLAPEPVPVEWFPHATAYLPTPLDSQLADPVGRREAVILLGRYALARIDGQGLQMHRLTQAIVRGHMPHGEVAVTQARAGAILTANHPGDPRAAQGWPKWARLLPHLLILEPTNANEGLDELACDAAEYLTWRGDARNGYVLSRRLYRRRRAQHGADDPLTLKAAAALALAMRKIGRYGEPGPLDDSFGPQETRELEEDILARRRRVLGEDHQDTLWSASSLATTLRALGEAAAARDLDEDTLSRSRRVQGEDHPSTLWFANGLAADLRALGDLQGARELDQDTLDRRRRVQGEDHPSTLWSAFNLAKDLRALGDLQAARELDQDTLDRRRRVLGEDHPDTLGSAAILREHQGDQAGPVS